MTDQEHFHALPKGYQFEDYEIVRVLGHGGFGITYLAYDDSLDMPVAIKEYLPDELAVRDATSSVVPKSTSLADDFDWGLQRFLDEAKTLARFRHQNLINVYRLFRANGTAYIVMEYAEGETLARYLKERGTLSEDEVKKILWPILSGLRKVHLAGILHRDIKPANIIVRDDGSSVLIDFGSARQAVGAKSRSITSIITPGYAPLEQYTSRGNQGPWTDIYALGAVVYKCVTGSKPPEAPERIKRDPYVPLDDFAGVTASKELASAVNSALIVDEEERTQSIEAWQKLLKRERSPASGTAVSSPKKNLAKRVFDRARARYDRGYSASEDVDQRVADFLSGDQSTEESHTDIGPIRPTMPQSEKERRINRRIARRLRRRGGG